MHRYEQDKNNPTMVVNNVVGIKAIVVMLFAVIWKGPANGRECDM